MPAREERKTMNFSVSDILEATGGRLLAGTADARAGALSTDTRHLGRGQMFLALRGERFDGHAFLADAVKAGAACLVVHDADAAAKAARKAGVAIALVEDTRCALADLGRAARSRLACPVIAVTGSCGKTTVKEMLGQILSRRLRGRVPPASYNNAVGVPLTLVSAEVDDEFVVCEVGTNAPGEIARLAGIARPTVGIVTLVAPTHLVGLGSVEGVAEEKAALVEALPPEGLAILNADDPRVAAMADRCSGRVVTVGTTWEADLQAGHVIQTDRGLYFTATGSAGFEVPVLGAHQAVLALEAAAAARELGIPLEASAEALRGFKPPPMRLALEEAGGVVVLNDAYNASPASMQTALDVLALWPDRRKVFFCGDMLELGEAAPAAHGDLGRRVAEAEVARLVCVGRHAKATAAAAVEGGLAARNVTAVDDAQAAADRVLATVEAGDVVLVKGSRAVGMERVATAIAGAFGGQTVGA